MTRAEASAILEGSFSRPTSTPSYEHERPLFLEQQKDRLRARLIEPIKISAVPSQWSQEHMGLDGEVGDFVAIAARESEWLLYSESTGQFWKAVGRTDSPPLELIGHSSDDALCEWYG